MLDHRIQHLGGRDDVLAGMNRHLDDFLLDDRHFFHRHFHAHVAAGYHDAVGNLKDFCQVLDSLHALDLGNDLDLGIILL